MVCRTKTRPRRLPSSTGRTTGGWVRRASTPPAASPKPPKAAQKRFAPPLGHHNRFLPPADPQTYYRRLVAAVYTATGDYHNAQDVVQEAFARALDRPQRFLAAADPQAYLRVVALNFARQRWRRQQVFDRLVRQTPLGRHPGRCG